MTKLIEFKCNSPDCDESGGSEVLGAYGHWLTLTVPENDLQMVYTNYGYVQARYDYHFHHPRCLLRWAEEQDGLAWTGKPDVLGRVDKEWEKA